MKTVEGEGGQIPKTSVADRVTEMKLLMLPEPPEPSLVLNRGGKSPLHQSSRARRRPPCVATLGAVFLDLPSGVTYFGELLFSPLIDSLDDLLSAILMNSQIGCVPTTCQIKSIDTLSEKPPCLMQCYQNTART